MNKKDAGVNTCIFFIVFFPVLVSSCKAYSCKESCMRKLKRRNKQEENMKRFEKMQESEDWRNDPFFASQEDNAEPISQKPKSREHWLMVIQIAVCACILLAIVCLKFFGGDLYTAFRVWYMDHVNQSILTDADLKNMEQKVLELFPSAAESSESEESISSPKETSSEEEKKTKEASSDPSSEGTSHSAESSSSSGG